MHCRQIAERRSREAARHIPSSRKPLYIVVHQPVSLSRTFNASPAGLPHSAAAAGGAGVGGGGGGAEEGVEGGREVEGEAAGGEAAGGEAAETILSSAGCTHWLADKPDS